MASYHWRYLGLAAVHPYLFLLFFFLRHVSAVLISTSFMAFQILLPVTKRTILNVEHTVSHGSAKMTSQLSEFFSFVWLMGFIHNSFVRTSATIRRYYWFTILTIPTLLAYKINIQLTVNIIIDNNNTTDNDNNLDFVALINIGVIELSEAFYCCLSLNTSNHWQPGHQWLLVWEKTFLCRGKISVGPFSEIIPLKIKILAHTFKKITHL